MTQNEKKLIPNYSYEFNKILNEQYTDENDQIKNFASLISDKDRFLALLPELENNFELIEEKLEYQIPKQIEFYIVRAEKFKSFSMPITIEYSICPEEMILYLFKEILKQTITERFPDEETREQTINSFIDYILINGTWSNSTQIIKFAKNLHEHSQKQYPNYQFKEIDFKDQTVKQHIESLYENFNF